MIWLIINHLGTQIDGTLLLYRHLIYKSPKSFMVIRILKQAQIKVLECYFIPLLFSYILLDFLYVRFKYIPCEISIITLYLYIDYYDKKQLYHRYIIKPTLSGKLIVPNTVTKLSSVSGTLCNCTTVQ